MWMKEEILEMHEGNLEVRLRAGDSGWWNILYRLGFTCYQGSKTKEGFQDAVLKNIFSWAEIILKTFKVRGMQEAVLVLPPSITACSPRPCSERLDGAVHTSNSSLPQD